MTVPEPAWCGVHQHRKWCEHNGGVFSEEGGWGPPLSPVVRSDVIDIEVRGVPVAKGSTRSFLVRKKGGELVTNATTGAPIIATTAANPRTKGWALSVSEMAQDAFRGEPWEGPLVVSCWFRFPRPRSIPRRKREYPDVKPDGDKLDRAVWDALTGICWRDDAQVVSWSGCKTYDDERPAGVTIRVSRPPGSLIPG